MLYQSSVAEFSRRENLREDHFSQIWTTELDEVFADVASYYDVANYVASLGFWGFFRKSFLSTMDLRSDQKILDLCAGTNAIGIALLRKQPGLHVYALDRSKEMQQVGRERAAAHGFNIRNLIGDAHHLPFPDKYFDVVTLQFASRHLRIMEVTAEIMRVLKPGGHFYHCDMLRPENKLIEKAYYSYLRLCLNLTAWIFNSSPSAQKCKKYFLNTLQLFYTTKELTELLISQGYQDVTCKSVFGGMLGFHKAVNQSQ